MKKDIIEVRNYGKVTTIKDYNMKEKPTYGLTVINTHDNGIFTMLEKAKVSSKGLLKYCSCCGNLLTMDKFHNDRKSKNGKQSQCKACKAVNS